VTAGPATLLWTRRKLELAIVAALTLALLFAAPAALSDFQLSLLAKFLTYAIVALGIDLIWGYAGMLSLGQGVFFGLGGYCMAMYLKLAVGTSSSGATTAYGGGAVLPDFMVWNGLTSLPWFWKPFSSFGVAIVMAVVLPAAVAAILGWLTFLNRIRGVYFAILTQALALIFTTLFIGQQGYTGGTNGLTDYKTILGASIDAPATQRALYGSTVIALLFAYVLCRYLTSGPFGRILTAIRDDEARLRFSGYDPAKFKLLVFAVSAGLAGLAGALFAPIVGIVSPTMMGIVPSIEMVIWVAVGGRGTLAGAVLGALLVNSAKSTLSDTFPDFWLYVLGSSFIVVVLLLPAGVLGLLARTTKLRIFPAATPVRAIAPEGEG
jgi:urea transport system permease protein